MLKEVTTNWKLEGAKMEKSFKFIMYLFLVFLTLFIGFNWPVMLSYVILKGV